jgi:hypothetical protein
MNTLARFTLSENNLKVVLKSDPHSRLEIMEVFNGTPGTRFRRLSKDSGLQIKSASVDSVMFTRGNCNRKR